MSDETYTIGQVFTSEYPTAAAKWCNANGAYIAEIDADSDGNRQFEIFENEEPTVEELRSAKLTALDTAFTTWREDTATLISSLGFTADADSRAMLDIQGLAILAEADPDNYSAVFMDADNEAHAVTADDVLTLRSEIIQSGTDAYTTKWTLRAAINAAETAEELSAIEIAFTPSDFSTSDEDEEEETTEESTDETTDTGSDSTTDESESE